MTLFCDGYWSIALLFSSRGITVSYACSVPAEARYVVIIFANADRTARALGAVYEPIQVAQDRQVCVFSLVLDPSLISPASPVN